MPEQSIGAAINAVTEEDITPAEEQPETSEDTSAEGTEGEEETPADGEVAEEEAETAEGEEEEEEEPESEEEEEEADPFDDMTPEALAKIKASPELNALRKGLMRSYTKKTQMASEALRLTAAYQRDPAGVLDAIAKSQGKRVVGAEAAPHETPKESTPDAVAAAGADLEKLFGDKIGPQVRQVFEKWFDARAGKYIAPIETTLGTVVSQGEAARMMSEEQAFKVRHARRLTPEIEKQVVDLGNSGMIVPGKDMTPRQYLDTLLEVVLARQARKDARTAKAGASKKLAARIAANAADREPSGSSGRGAVRKVSKVTEARNISEALDIASRELDEESA